MAMGHFLKLKTFKEAELDFSLAAFVGLISDDTASYSVLLI